MTPLAILGGTFNPIHCGHLHVAHVVSTQLRLESVRFMPAAVPPHKPQPAVLASQRAEMVALAIADTPQFSLDCQELDRVGHSYTFDTLVSLRHELGDEVSLSWLVGQDADVDTWHRSAELLDYCHFVVVARPTVRRLTLPKLFIAHQTQDQARITNTPSGAVLCLDVGALPVSSTTIRQRLAMGLSVQGMVPPSVEAYIADHGLYASA